MEYLTIDNVALVAFAVISMASVAAKILDVATDIKPSDRFDKYASTIRRRIAQAENILDKLALNPKR